MPLILPETGVKAEHDEKAFVSRVDPVSTFTAIARVGGMGGHVAPRERLKLLGPLARDSLDGRRLIEFDVEGLRMAALVAMHGNLKLVQSRTEPTTQFGSKKDLLGLTNHAREFSFENSLDEMLAEMQGD